MNRETDHSPPSSSKVKNGEAVPFLHHTSSALNCLLSYQFMYVEPFLREAIKFHLRFVKRNKGYMNKHSQHEIRLTTLGTVPNLVEICWLLLACMRTKKHDLLNCAITYGCG
jgi:hypothetical protein